MSETKFTFENWEFYEDEKGRSRVRTAKRPPMVDDLPATPGQRLYNQTFAHKFKDHTWAGLPWAELGPACKLEWETAAKSQERKKA